MELQPDLTGRRVGRYEIRSLLGRGGMGAVYRAYDPTLDRQVAIKILPPSLVTDADRVQRFVLEAKSASALNHPAVVSIYEIGEDDSLHYIAMELVEGTTLHEHIHGGPLPLGRALAIGEQIAEAIGAAHEAGVVHRDLKPENIIIATPGYVKVLDFGLAKLRREPRPAAGEGTSSGKSTEPGKLLGTAGYMSPEQAEGKPVDH
ncbi:MAG TPA: protein kinase, partial [Thermoanaerobaculia bacterium]|nr:protein kinase [Thermoanaerobaculia bacterium]